MTQEQFLKLNRINLFPKDSGAPAPPNGFMCHLALPSNI